VNRRRWVLGPGAVAAGRDITGPVTINVVAGEFERLGDAIFDPTPLAEELDLDRFVGREWLINKIDEYIDSHRNGYVVVHGEAGIGKSALAAHLVWSRGCVNHFTRLPGGRSPEQARRSLAAQLVGTWRLAGELAAGDVFPVGADRPDWLLKVIQAAAAQRKQPNPDDPLVLVVDGLDEADPPADGQDTGIPLGLPRPEHLPGGVFIIVTSRFGRPLPALYKHVSWHTIAVDSPDNLEDMRQYLDRAVNGSKPNEQLVELLTAGRVSKEWFIETLLRRCAGVWIYMRYVLEAILEQRRGVTDLTTLPEALSGYYIEQIHRWQQIDSWASLGLPALATLAALRRQITMPELAQFAQVDDGEPLRLWLDQQLRPFLYVTHDSSRRRLYYIRHESMRELFHHPDVAPGDDSVGIGDALYAAVVDANDRIVTALVPRLTGRRRDWRGVDSYTRVALPEHAAECGRLDELTANAGFLLCTEPSAVLRWRARLSTDKGLASLAAYQLSLGQPGDQDYLGQPGDQDYEVRAWWLHTWARKTRADRLAESAAELSESDWLIGRAWWSGTGYQALGGYRHGVLAVTIGQMDETDVIVFGDEDGTLQIWDPGSNVTQTVLSHNGAVLAVAAGRVADTDVIASGSLGTVRIWDAGWRNGPTELTGYQGWSSIVIGQLNGRDVVAFGGWGGALRIWDFGTRSELPVPEEPAEGVGAVAIGRINNQDVIVTGGTYHTIRIWHPDGHSQPFAVPGSRDPWSLSSNVVSAIAVSRMNGRDVVVSGDEEGTIRIWDPSGQVEPTSLSAHDHDVRSVAICYVDGRDVIITAGQQRASDSSTGSVRLWDLAEDSATPVILMDYQLPPYKAGDRGEVRSMAVGRIGGRDVVVSGGDDQTVRIRNLGGPPEPAAQWGHHGAVTAITIGLVEGQDVVVSASADGTLRILDPIGNVEPVNLMGHNEPVYSIAAGQVEGEDVIVSAGSDQTVRIWHPAGHTEPIAFHSQVRQSESEPWQLGSTTAVIGRVGNVNMIAAADDNGAYVLGRNGRIVLANNWPGKKLLAAGQLARRDVVVIANRGITPFLRDAGANAREVQIWDPATDGKVILISDDLNRPESIAVGRFGERDVIVIADTDTLLIWDPISRVQLAALSGRNAFWHVAVYEMDGQEVIVTAGADSITRIWKWNEGLELMTELTGHVSPIDAMAVGRLGDQNGIVTGYRDGTALLWLPRRRTE